jgi:hypothetical protein
VFHRIRKATGERIELRESFAHLHPNPAGELPFTPELRVVLAQTFTTTRRRGYRVSAGPGPAVLGSLQRACVQRVNPS